MSQDHELETFEGEAREESITTELADVEVVDFDAPPEVTKLLAAEGPPAPDPESITSQIADTDLEDLLEGQDEANGVDQSSLAARMTFGNAPKPQVSKQPLNTRIQQLRKQREEERAQPWYRRLLRFLCT